MNTSASLATGEQCLQGAHPVALTMENRDESAGRGHTMTLLVLALGSFVIGTSEFASMGIIQLFAGDPLLFFPGLFGIGAAMMMAIPTIQVRLTRFAPEAPSLARAMNLAALNAANALGAWSGGLSIGAGFGLLSAVWAGFGLTLVGLILFGLTLVSQRPAARVI